MEQLFTASVHRFEGEAWKCHHNTWAGPNRDSVVMSALDYLGDLKKYKSSIANHTSKTNFRVLTGSYQYTAKLAAYELKAI